jgi:tetratricopeptide (TPR) repeat protein
MFAATLRAAPKLTRLQDCRGAWNCRNLGAMTAEKILLAAQGYLELGMAAEALVELDGLPAVYRKRSDVLKLRVTVALHARCWQDGLAACQRLCEAEPQETTGFIHAAFCLHELGRTDEARDVLLHGPPALLNEATYYYNMGCYNARLGFLEDAQNYLRMGFSLDGKLRDFARHDPDLKEVRHLI